jgi:hypothetical protein
MFWGFPVTMEVWTGCRSMRRGRQRGQHRRSLPVAERMHYWRWLGVDDLWFALEGSIYCGRVQAEGIKGCQSKRRGTRPERGLIITWECRIQAGMAAGMVDPDEELRRPGGAISLEKERGTRGDRGDFIGAEGCQIWLEIRGN